MIFKKTKKYLKKQWRLVAVIAMAMAFFIGASSFNYLTQDSDFVKWASPDETANYIFAKLYSQEGNLTIFEQYNLYADDIMLPRSFRSDDGHLKPVSFLGLVLIYGRMAGWTSYKILPYLTPFFAAVGLVYFYLLIKKIFGRRNALITVFLLASFPPFIYYSARSMFHNVLFVVLLVISLYYLVLMVRQKQIATNQTQMATDLNTNGHGFKHKWPRIDEWRGWLYAALGGGFMGLAVAVRTSELLWLAPIMLCLWFWHVKKTGPTKLIIFVSFSLLAMLPVFYYNQILYGSFYFGGYTEMNQSLVNIAQAGSDLIKSTGRGEFFFHQDLLNKIKDNVFYFGFHGWQSLSMFYFYFIKMFSWLFWPAVLGLVLFLQRRYRLKRKYAAYLLSYLVVLFILIFYYGSWEFHDNPDPNSRTIGNSYARYWLPVYLGALPFVSLFIMKLTRAMTALIRNYVSCSKKFCLSGLRALMIIGLSCISVQFVLFGSEEGLFYFGQRRMNSRAEWSRILDLTESNAAIITLYHDKLLFPERKVIVGLFDNKKMVAKYAELVDLLPLYYYNFTLPRDAIDYLNKSRLGEVDLQIEEVKQITKDFTLYRLSKK